MKKKIGKVFKIIGIIILVLIAYNVIDLAQAVIFKNTPIISLKTDDNDSKNGKRKYGLLFSTYVYCNNEKQVELAFRAYLRPYHYKGCEENAAEDIIKPGLEGLAQTKDYQESEDYALFIKAFTGSIPTIEKLYEDGELTDEAEMVATSVITDLAGCKDKYKLDKWNTTEEFFDVWQKSKCREKYMKKYKFE